jgi:hypothetical protein
MSFGGTRADVGMIESCRCRADHRSRHHSVAEQLSCAPTFPTMYCCLSLLFGGTRAVVAQCRVVEARAALSTIDLASHARWCRRRVRQGCVRYAFTYRCRVVERAHFRPSISPPMHGGAAAVCAKVAYDMRLRIVVVWWNARRCRTMSTRRGALCSVDHRPHRPCTVAPPPCAPRFPTMY